MAVRATGIWLVQIPGWLLLAYLVYAQAIPAFNYALGVRMGTQESAEQITEVGTAFWYGFAFADLVVYLPLLAAGLLGHCANRQWSSAILGASLGITLYWPVVVLAAAIDARDAWGWEINEGPFWVVLPLIFVWASGCLWHIALGKHRSESGGRTASSGKENSVENVAIQRRNTGAIFRLRFFGANKSVSVLAWIFATDTIHRLILPMVFIDGRPIARLFRFSLQFRQGRTGRAAN